MHHLYAGPEQSHIDVPIDDVVTNGVLNIYPEIEDKDLFRIYHKKRKLVFQARGYVGIIPINSNVTIEIYPRWPISNLERLLHLAQPNALAIAPHTRAFDSHTSQIESIVDSMADALIESVATIRAKGLFKEYARLEAATLVPRGRLLADKTLRKLPSHQQPPKLQCVWHERLVDTPANRCIKYAIWRIAATFRPLRAQSRKRHLLTKLSEAYSLFDRVFLDHRLGFLNHNFVHQPSQLPSTRDYYGQAIALSKAIIHSKGISFSNRGTELVLNTLLISMDDVFEKYIRVTLQRANLSGGQIAFDGNINYPNGAAKALLDDDPDGHQAEPVKATPDIVIASSTNLGETASVVIEVKYRNVKNRPDREDLNQVLAYAISYQTKIAMLLYPRTDAVSPQLLFMGNHGGIPIYRYFFDLASPSLEVEELTLVSTIDRLIAMVRSKTDKLAA